MCDLSGGFVLCTCDDGRPDWVLRRRNHSLPEVHMRGRCHLPTFDEDDELRILFVADGLNEGCFDFAYVPVEGDVFDLTVAEKRLSFVYEKGSWSHQVLTGFEVWSEQLEDQSCGDLILPADAVPDGLIEACDQSPAKEGADVLRDWVLEKGHPELARWLRARLAGEDIVAKVGPKMQQRLEKIFRV